MKYLYTYEIDGNEYRYVSDMKLDKEDLIEFRLDYKYISEYYSDIDKFLNERVKNFKEEELVKSLFLVETGIIGWDTYDSAVYCAYCGDEVRDYLEDDLGRKYRCSKIKKIGTALASVDVGLIISSFNAG